MTVLKDIDPKTGQPYCYDSMSLDIVPCAFDLVGWLNANKVPIIAVGAGALALTGLGIAFLPRKKKKERKPVTRASQRAQPTGESWQERRAKCHAADGEWRLDPGDKPSDGICYGAVMTLGRRR